MRAPLTLALAAAIAGCGGGSDPAEVAPSCDGVIAADGGAGEEGGAEALRFLRAQRQLVARVDALGAELRAACGAIATDLGTGPADDPAICSLATGAIAGLIDACDVCVGDFATACAVDLKAARAAIEECEGREVAIDCLQTHTDGACGEGCARDACDVLLGEGECNASLTLAVSDVCLAAGLARGVACPSPDVGAAADGQCASPKLVATLDANLGGVVRATATQEFVRVIQRLLALVPGGTLATKDEALASCIAPALQQLVDLTTSLADLAAQAESLLAMVER
ncbi:MAG: hypothetical protein AABZ30_07765 [Myxococcota bacterium]